MRKLAACGGSLAAQQISTSSNYGSLVNSAPRWRHRYFNADDAPLVRKNRNSILVMGAAPVLPLPQMSKPPVSPYALSSNISVTPTAAGCCKAKSGIVAASSAACAAAAAAALRPRPAALPPASPPLLLTPLPPPPSPFPPLDAAGACADVAELAAGVAAATVPLLAAPASPWWWWRPGRTSSKEAPSPPVAL